MPKVVVIGSILSHGGAVVEGSAITTSLGLPVCRVGDKAVCSVHGATTIVSGSSIYTDEGKPVALSGHLCGCGAVITSIDTLVEVSS